MSFHLRFSTRLGLFFAFFSPVGLHLRRLNCMLAALSGACAGAHITVQVIYTVWADDGMRGALVYGLLVTNRAYAA